MEQKVIVRETTVFERNASVTGAFLSETIAAVSPDTAFILPDLIKYTFACSYIVTYN